MLGITRTTICGLLAGACVAAAVPTAVAAAAPAPTYTVHRGDTLGRIASHNHTTVAHLVDLNGGRYPSLRRNPHLIRVGWVLVLDSSNAPASTPAPTAPQGNTYTVRRGDTLGRIAARYHTTVARLVAVNKGRFPSLATNPHRIYAGWVLTVR